MLALGTQHGLARASGAAMNIVLAAHSREVKTSLYLALNTVSNITIVATAASTAEFVSYCHSFLPDVAIVETGLPGRPLPEVLTELEQSATPRRILIIGGDEATDLINGVAGTELLRDIDHLASILPELELENGIR